MSIGDFTLDSILSVINIETRTFGYNALCKFISNFLYYMCAFLYCHHGPFKII